MEAYVYLRVRPGAMHEVLTGLASTQGVRRAIAVVGDWDVLALVDGTDFAAVATQVLSDFQQLPGVERTMTAPVVPPDRVGIAGWGAPSAPAIIGDACYVHIKAEAGAAAGLAERLGDMPDVSGVAVLGGRYDLVACVAQPWEVASGVILEQIHALPGIRDTHTLVSIIYEEPGDDRDQFSTWS
ncbi:MAG: Lrp/AsnC ligand binding domain-containing protein [Actinomycetota bacterium]